MREVRLDTQGWDKHVQRLRAALEAFPERKAELLEQVGRRVREEVRSQTGQSGLHDSRGRVKSWQNYHPGSGLGYVAVRPDSIEVMSGGGNKRPLNAGALTHYLTSGHRVRPPSGRAKRYVPRARMAKAPGFHFYRRARRQAEEIAGEEAEKFAGRMKGGLA